MPVRTAVLLQAGRPRALARPRRRADGTPVRAASALLAGTLVGSAAAGPLGWWATASGLVILALATFGTRTRTALLVGALAVGAAAAAWLVVDTAPRAAPTVVAILVVSSVVGAGYGWLAGLIQHWSGWPLLLPLLWLGLEAAAPGVIAWPRIDDVAISQIPDERASILASALAGPLVAVLLGVAACMLALAVREVRRWSWGQTAATSLAVVLASVGLLIALENAVHPHAASSAGGTDSISVPRARSAVA